MFSNIYTYVHIRMTFLRGHRTNSDHPVRGGLTYCIKHTKKGVCRVAHAFENQKKVRSHGQNYL